MQSRGTQHTKRNVSTSSGSKPKQTLTWIKTQSQLSTPIAAPPLFNRPASAPAKTTPQAGAIHSSSPTRPLPCPSYEKLKYCLNGTQCRLTHDYSTWKADLHLARTLDAIQGLLWSNSMETIHNKESLAVLNKRIDVISRYVEVELSNQNYSPNDGTGPLHQRATGSQFMRRRRGVPERLLSHNIRGLARGSGSHRRSRSASQEPLTPIVASPTKSAPSSSSTKWREKTKSSSSEDQNVNKITIEVGNTKEAEDMSTLLRNLSITSEGVAQIKTYPTTPQNSQTESGDSIEPHPHRAAD